MGKITNNNGTLVEPQRLIVFTVTYKTRSILKRKKLRDFLNSKRDSIMDKFDELTLRDAEQGFNLVLLGIGKIKVSKFTKLDRKMMKKSKIGEEKVGKDDLV